MRGLYPDGRDGARFFIDQAELDLLERDGPEWKLQEGPIHRGSLIKETRPHLPRAQAARPRGRVSLIPSGPRMTPMTQSAQPDSAAASASCSWYSLEPAWVVSSYSTGEWRAEDADKPGHPVGWENDFVVLTWAQDLDEYLNSPPPQRISSGPPLLFCTGRFCHVLLPQRSLLCRTGRRPSHDFFDL